MTTPSAPFPANAAPSPHLAGARSFDDELLARGRLAVEVTGTVLTITLDRPDIRNAQLPATWEALAYIGSRVPAHIRVVVVRGSGESFSSGLDRSMFTPGPESVLMQIASAPDTVAHHMIADFQRGFTWLSDPSFVSIAAVRGHAVGAGFQLALACDLVVAADDAQFCMAEVGLGLVPDLGGTGSLVRAVGYQRALEICVTGRRVGAPEAVRIGLALVSAPAADLDVAVGDLVDAILAVPVEAGRSVTRLIGSATVLNAEDQLVAEQSEQVKRLRELAAGGGR
ncbi:enoyl-CoA hydratase/carnithine racemase [Nakamurella sp. UYEF19]|uniref:enoyl-CoA hydratase/isomerase family protein n=1 Tax=Nakamurella sp. UYEF19 TaxID=1756392 RepID=UPI003393919F